MGRTAKGWGLVWRDRRDEQGRRVRKADVRFRHGGKRVQIPTGCATAADASKRAADIYAKYVAGEWERGKPGPLVNTATDLPELVADWTDAVAPERDEETIERYGRSAKHWVAHFGTMRAFFDEARRADYVRLRLTKVLAPTVRYELSSIRGFLNWCKEQRLVSDVPVWPRISARTIGTRVHTFTTTDLTIEEVVGILCALPVLSANAPHFIVRDRFIFAYETGLRPATIDQLRRSHYRGGEIHITPEIDKNRYARPIPLTDVARAAFERNLPDDEDGLVFGRHTYEIYLKAAARTVLPPERVKTFTAYDLRHMRGTHLAEATGDLPGIAYLFGHLQLTTTNKYMHPTKRAAMRVLSGADQTGNARLLSAQAMDGGERNGHPQNEGFTATSRNYYDDAVVPPGREGADGRYRDASGDHSGAEHPSMSHFGAQDAADRWALTVELEGLQ